MPVRLTVQIPPRSEVAFQMAKDQSNVVSFSYATCMPSVFRIFNYECIPRHGKVSEEMRFLSQSLLVCLYLFWRSFPPEKSTRSFWLVICKFYVCGLLKTFKRQTTDAYEYILRTNSFLRDALVFITDGCDGFAYVSNFL